MAAYQKRRISIFQVLCMALAAWASSACPAAAEDDLDGWTFTVAPYFWAPSVKGDVTVRGRSSSVDASFKDIVEDANSIFAYFSFFEARKNRLSFFASPSYMDISMDEHTKVGPLSLDSDITAKLFFLEFGAAYQVLEWGQGDGGTEPFGGSLDLFAGGRYTNLDLKIDLDVGGLPPAFSGNRKVDGNQDWVDPIVGAVTEVQLSDRWRARLRGDVGSFGVGSRIALQGLALVGYEFDLLGRDATVFGGYRALYQDYDNGSGANRFEWDITLHGPVLGLRMVF